MGGGTLFKAELYNQRINFNHWCCTAMSFRKQWEPILEKIARRLAKDEINVERQGRVTIRHYYCTSVMDVVRHLRRFTKAKDEQGQHDVLKILLKYYQYGRRGRFEIKKGRHRLDIVIDDEHLAISVKTIVDVTVKKVREKASLVLSLKREQQYPADRVWIAFFYKFKDNASPKNACKYLFCWIDIDITGVVDTRTLNEDLMAVVLKTKKVVADKLDVDDEIIIPVDNIMLVEEMERESQEKDKLLEANADLIDHIEEEKAEQTHAIVDQAKTIANQAKAIAEKDKAIAEKDKANATLLKENAALKKRFGVE
jgi:hypothetical protein